MDDILTKITNGVTLYIRKNLPDTRWCMVENISVLIITDDKDYGKALGTGIINVCRSFMIKIMNWEELFAERKNFYLNDRDGVFLSRYDLVLWDGTEASGVYGDKIILLSSDPVEVMKNYQEKKFCLYKYSSARAIVSALLDIYSFMTGKCAVNLQQRDVELLAFVSAAGGTGTTTLAMATGQELSRFRGKKVLYLSFEEVESTGEYMECLPGIKSVGIYLYHLFRNEKGTPFIESYIVNDGFGIEAFAPTSGRNPLRNLTGDELNVFLSSLAEGGRYDVIIMDIGNNLCENDMICMDIAEKICFVDTSKVKSARESQYLQYLICSCGEKIIEKMIKVQNMLTRESDEISREESGDMLTTDIYISKYSAVQTGNGATKVILENNFGEKIKQLTEKLMERKA